MDFISGATSLAQKAAEAYGDYKTGRDTRLGHYKGSDNIKKLGHYSASGKRLGIYHH